MKSQFLARLLLPALGSFAGLFALTAQSASAQTVPLISEVRTITTSSVGNALEYQFDISAAGNYSVTLTDLGALQTPAAPVASVKMALTSNTSLVGTPLTAAGTLNFTAAAAGSYGIHIVGAPGSVPGSGSVGIQVTSADRATVLYNFSGVLTLSAPQVPDGTALLDDSFTVGSTGSYQVSLLDLNLPHTLAVLTLAITTEGGTTPLLILPDASLNYQGSVALQTGVKYRIFAIGQADPGSSAGLYTASVIPGGGGSAIFSKAIAVGNTKAAGDATLTAGPHTLTLTDLQFPAALTQLQTTVIYNGQSVASLPAAGTASFTAVAGVHRVFTVATPVSTTPSAGSFAIQIAPAGGTPELSIARSAADPTSGVAAYSFDTSIISAGAYTANLTNFSAPVPLTVVRMATVQGGAVVGTPVAAAGAIAFNGTAGPISLLVLAQPDPTLGGLFDVNLTAAGSTSLLYDMAQPVGAASNSEKLSITAGGSYDITATDLAFPAQFQSFIVTVTQGGNLIGSIFSLGKLTLTAQPGNYFVNVLARPSGTDNAGTYALTADASPLPPTISLDASPATVDSGHTSTLTWSTTNATACTASDGWTGTQPVKGNFASVALTASTTFTLTCTGDGGSASKSVTVAVNLPPKAGGGGSIDLLLLAMLTMGLVLRFAPPARRFC